MEQSLSVEAKTPKRSEIILLGRFWGDLNDRSRKDDFVSSKNPETPWTDFSDAGKLECARFRWGHRGCPAGFPSCNHVARDRGMKDAKSDGKFSLGTALLARNLRRRIPI